MMCLSWLLGVLLFLSAQSASLAETPGLEMVSQPTQKIIAIGDIHGDLNAWIKALQLAGAIDSSLKWIGRNLTVIQTGDLIDRGPSDKSVLDFSEKLVSQAHEAGGRLLLLNGNHEIMNALGDMRYTNPESFLEFKLGTPAPADLKIGSLLLPETVKPNDPGVTEKAFQFMPGNFYGKILAKHPIYAIIDDTLFVHGGILPANLNLLEKINPETNAWLEGNGPTPDWVSQGGKQSPIWNRDYGASYVSNSICNDLETVLNKLSVKRMVIGHTIQDHGINSACGGKVWRIDVQLSSYYHKGKKTYPVEILSIKDRQVTVIKKMLNSI